MATTNYHTVNGEILGETTAGVRTNYLTDGLGNVTATQNAAGTTTATYRYKPFGDLLAKTGAGADPRFMWVGALGYSTNLLSAASHYVRARHYGATRAVWTSVDPVWPALYAYNYVSGNPTSEVDPSGLACCCCALKLTLENLSDILPGTTQPSRIGNKFDVRFEMAYISPGSGQDCTMEWREMSNFGLVNQATPKKWGPDVIKNPPQGLQGFDGWFKHKQPCPGKVSDKIHDEPALGYSGWVGKNYPTRILYIQVRLRSSAGCVMKVPLFLLDGGGVMNLPCPDLTLRLIQVIYRDASGQERAAICPRDKDVCNIYDPPKPPWEPWP